MGSRRADTLRIVLVCGAVFWSLGCQRVDDPARIAVSGTVTTESGEPIDGTISFLPKNGTEGPAATASLNEGVFSFRRENGPVAGEYRVLVVRNPADRKHKGTASATDEKGATTAAAAADDPSLSDQEWSFEASVSAEDFQFDFEVPE